MPAALKGVMEHGGYDERFDDLAGIAYRVAYRMLGGREDARDVAQEAMARAYVHWRKASRYPEAWVSRVAANLAIDGLRRRDRPAVPSAADSADHGPGSAERVELVRALEALPRRQREVVVLRYLADLPEAEVAAQLGCAPGTVKQHASRGLAALRSALAQPVLLPAPTAPRLEEP